MPEQALIPMQLFMSAPSWGVGTSWMQKHRAKWHQLGMVPSEGMAVPKRNSRKEVLAQCRSRRDKMPSKILMGRARPCGQHLPDAAHFGARSDKGVMSPLGKREQILGRAQEHLSPQQLGRHSHMPVLASPARHQPPSAHTQGTAGVVGLGRAHSPQPIQCVTVHRKHHPSQWLAWHAMSPLPMGAALMPRQRQTGLG